MSTIRSGEEIWMDDGGRGLPRWRVAHDALHEDVIALARLFADKERIAASLGVLESHMGRLATREEKVRLVEAEQEAFERESAALKLLLDEVDAAREAALADHTAGREDAECRALDAQRELDLLAVEGEERDEAISRLETEFAAGFAAFDEHHTTVFLRLHDQVRSWLERYDPSGALRDAGKGGGNG